MINNSKIHGGKEEGAGRGRVQSGVRIISALNLGYQCLLSTRIEIVLFIYFRISTPFHWPTVPKGAALRWDLITAFCESLRESFYYFTRNSRLQTHFRCLIFALLFCHCSSVEVYSQRPTKHAMQDTRDERHAKVSDDQSNAVLVKSASSREHKVSILYFDNVQPY